MAGYQRRPDRRVGSKSEGCLAVQTPADLAARADIVVTMLADGAASYAVHLGGDGLFASTGSATLVEMGTMSPDHIADLVATAQENIRVIDAPVSGRHKLLQVQICWSWPTAVTKMLILRPYSMR
ncbi:MULTISPECIES: NAD(P)-binding domain-containing protein [unclassified Phaeobacter]|uniref:NAD(P)-binding domain-containing protein n=1 Tax=unclassified Phaeobacter TaxID=2621772 RepID=UPI003A87F208